MLAPQERADRFLSADGSTGQRPRHSQHVVPVPRDQFGVDAVPRQAVHRPVIGGVVDAPEPGLADVGEPGAELVAQEPEQAENDVAGPRRIGHDFQGAQARLLFQQTFQDEQRIAERTGEDDAVEPGELVGGEVVLGDPSAGPEVLAVWPGVDGADWHHQSRSPSAEATSPPPQACASGIFAWASTRRALAPRVRVSART